jgi:hypothetical protein
MTYRAMALGTMVSAALVAPMTAQAQSEPGNDDRDQPGYVTQVRPREHERVMFTIGAGYVPSFGRNFTDEATGTLKDGRSTRVTIDYDLRHAINIDMGAVVMLNRMWGVGVMLDKSRFENVEATTTLSAFPGGSDFREQALRKEDAVRLELTRVLLRNEGQPDPFDPETDRGTGYVVRVFGGPTYYRVQQHLFTLRGTTEAELLEGNGWGYHGGLDLAMYTSFPGLGGPGVGFGTTIRYSGGSVRLPGLLRNEPSNRPAGGLNITYNIRIRI